MRLPSSNRDFDETEAISDFCVDGHVDNLEIPVEIILGARPPSLGGHLVPRSRGRGDVVERKVKLVDEMASEEVDGSGSAVVLRLEDGVRKETERAA